MDFAGKSTKGVTALRHLWVLHGEPGTGKSTLASKFPDVVFADIEGGTKDLNVERFDAKALPKYETLVEFVEWLRKPQQKYKTLVIDSATVLEAYMQAKVCGTKYESIADIGFGKGFQQVRELAQEFMLSLRQLVEEKMDVIITAHSQKKNFSDPISNTEWTRYELQCDVKLAQILLSASDNVFFLKQEVNTVTDNQTNKTKASSDGNRLIMTSWRPAFDAKNRLNLPCELPLDYEALCQAIKDGKLGSSPELISRIKEITSKSSEQIKKIAEVKINDCAGDVACLQRLKLKMEEMVKAI